MGKIIGLIEQRCPVADENDSVNWRRVASDFAHNALFSFAVGPFINGMSSAINHNGFWKGVKEVATSWRGWRCNAELAIAVGVIATTVNAMMGRSYAKTSPHQAAHDTLSASAPLDEKKVGASHSAREEARREQPVDASISR